MRVLILGSHGCVGNAVVKYFQKEGNEVIPWDIKMGDDYDLRKVGNLDLILPTVDFVIFLAFDVGGSKYNVNSMDFIQNNVDLMRNTFQSLEKYKIPFLYTSSMMSNMNNNPYAVLKRLGEFYTDVLGGLSVKLWNVYGSEPITEKSHVIPDFIQQAIEKNEISMRTEGKEERLFLYCDDLACALYTIVKDFSRFKEYKEVDISSKKWVTIKEVANIIKDLTKELLQKNIEVREGSYVDTFHNRKNEPQDSFLNTVWNPTTTLEQGIRNVFLSMIEPK